MAKVKKEKAEGKTNGNGRRGRESQFKDDMKITVLVSEGNPKREGTRGHEVFGHYRGGMLVKTFIEKVGDRGEAMANLRYDSAKEFISIA